MYSVITGILFAAFVGFLHFSIILNVIMKYLMFRGYVYECIFRNFK